MSTDPLDPRPGRNRRGQIAAAAIGVGVVAISLSAVVHHSDHHVVGPGGGRQPAPSESPGASATAPESTERQLVRACRHYAATHSFLKADRAVTDPSGAVTITGHAGFETCGGPSDVSYDWRHATETFVVAPSAVVRRFAFSNTGPASKTISPTALPRYLRHDQNTRFFRYHPPKTGITRLVELYHP